MSFEINTEEKTITVLKDCSTCQHLKVCRFHKEISDVTKTNDFYSIVTYAEWNNALAVFEKHASCSHFLYKYNVGQTVSLESAPEIIEKVIRLMGAYSWSSDFKKNNSCSVKNVLGDKLDAKVSDLLENSKYFIADKIKSR